LYYSIIAYEHNDTHYGGGPIFFARGTDETVHAPSEHSGCDLCAHTVQRLAERLRSSDDTHFVVRGGGISGLGTTVLVAGDREQETWSDRCP
jgi:hypothetical protein